VHTAENVAGEAAVTGPQTPNKTPDPRADAAGAPAPSDKPVTKAAELVPRIVSGVVLAGVSFGLLYLGVIPFTGLVLLVALAMSWEWGHIVRGSSFDTTFVVHAAAVGAGVVLAGIGYAALGVIAVTVGTCIVGALTFSGQRLRLSAIGVPYVGLPSVSLLWLRADEPYGFQAVMFLLLTVVTTDTAAYAFGRTFGGPKLWPRVSPNKTWSGLIGGVATAGVAAAAYATLVPGASSLALGVSGILLGLVAQAGDLAESHLKRIHGVKDASRLIPGHGGFMDRMDGMVGAATLAALLAAAINIQAPARALLTWHP
jgi:phosphatidate cytidylyltransferase